MKTKRVPIGRWRWIGLLLLLLLVAACRREEPAPADIPLPVEEPAATVAATETAEPTTAPTATTPPTETPEPTATPKPTATPNPATVVPRFEEADCEFEEPDGVEVACGYLIVPEDRDDPENNNTLSLHVAVFPSRSDEPAPAPLLYLEGGPGGDALEGIPFGFEERFGPFLEAYTFIMFDQRGTGYSLPSLACPENTELMLAMLDELPTDEEALAANLEMMDACRARLLDERVNLAVYNSAASAADVDDLRRVLGYEQVNLYGISYGTRLAQTIMRDYPQGVRSVVLDSSYPISADLVTEVPRNADRAFQIFFGGCAADPECVEAYPDLEARFFALVERLDEEPITVPVTYFLTSEQYDAALAGDDLIGLVFQALYSSRIIPALPQMIVDAETDNYDLLSSLLAVVIANSEFSSLGMYYAVQCAEEIPFAGAETLEDVTYPRLRQYYEGGSEDNATVCALWAVPTAAALENEAIQSDIPTLVLAGEYDPITPPSWGEQVAATLENVYFFEFPGLGHGVSTDDDCPRQVMLDFLAEPAVEPDASCIGGMEGPGFIVRGRPEPVTLVPFTSEFQGTVFNGVVPEGWKEEGDALFVRQQTALDQTALWHLVIPGGSAELFVRLLAQQFESEEPLEVVDTYTDATGREWEISALDFQNTPLRLAATEAGGVAYIVMLFGNDDEIDFYTGAALLPALEALRIEE